MKTGTKRMKDGIMKKSLFFAAALLALAACTRELAIDLPTERVTITARTETSAETRTLVDGTHVLWEPEDEIKVFQDRKSGRFSTDITASSATAEFTGMMDLTEGANLWALYPYSDDAAFDGTSITTTLPAAQVARAGSFDQGMNLAVAHSATPDLQFYNVGGGVRFSLAASDITAVKLEGRNGETLAGKVQIGFQDGLPAIQSVSAGKTAITLTPAEGGAFQPDTWYFIVAIPGALENGFKLTFSKADAVGTRVVDKAVTVKRGTFGTLAHADEGATFNPISENNIVFKDDLVKSILVQHFDTNEDGEISYQEAAAVTSFVVDEAGTRADGLAFGIFTMSQIISFDELVYFTGMTEIESYALAGCEKLVSVTIPENVVAFGDFALFASPALASITLTSPTPATLGDSAFSMTSDCPIYVPEGCVDAYVEAWSEYAFRITTAKPGNEIQYTSTDGQIVTPCIYDPTGAGRFPDPVDVFGADIVSNTYVDGKGVIVFDGDVTDVGENAFAGCSNLASITLPETVTSIGNTAFFHCSNLTDIALQPGIVSIGRGAFRDCSSLESIVIPSTVTSIGRSLFAGCTGLMSIEVKSGNPVYVSRRTNAIYEISSMTLIAGCASTEIPDGVKAIDDYAFEDGVAPAELLIPESVTKIGKYAFYECAGLENVTIPGSVEKIENYVFYGCPDLKHVDVDDGVTSIGNFAFYECPQLENVYLPESLTDIGSAAFAYCSSLYGVEMSGIETIGAGAFAYCSAMRGVTLWTNCTQIGDMAFLDCSALKYIVVVAPTPPAGGESMFDGSSCLIYVPEFSWSVYQTADKWSPYWMRIRPLGVDEYITSDAVDLGLPSGIKWASRNLGASKPEDFGGYYAWGETETKMVYDIGNYKWINLTIDGFYNGETKYVSEYCAPQSQYVDNKTVLDPEDDAARVNLGGNWRMPTYIEMKELDSCCDKQWTQLNGVNGWTLTGPNGNSIFLPAAGVRDRKLFDGIGSLGRYWSNQVSYYDDIEPYVIYFDEVDFKTGQIGLSSRDSYWRVTGVTIRPVYDESLDN